MNGDGGGHLQGATGEVESRGRALGAPSLPAAAAGTAQLVGRRYEHRMPINTTLLLLSVIPVD